MSGYLDALRRAALGLPGDAMPRPRALYEAPPGGLGAAFDAEGFAQETEEVEPGPDQTSEPTPRRRQSRDDRDFDARAEGPPPTVFVDQAQIAPPQDRTGQNTEEPQDTRRDALALQAEARPSRDTESRGVSRPFEETAPGEAGTAHLVGGQEHGARPLGAGLERPSERAALEDMPEPAVSGRIPDPQAVTWSAPKQTPDASDAPVSQAEARALIDAVLTPEPAVGPERQANEPQSDDQPDSVELVVEIGQIDIRITPERPMLAASGAAGASRAAGAPLSLDDYLARRGTRGS